MKNCTDPSGTRYSVFSDGCAASRKNGTGRKKRGYHLEKKYYLAIDIGASSGRHILGSYEDRKISLEEIYRFDNGMDDEGGTLTWDADRLFDEIINGMKKCAVLGKIPESVGVDTWGVDYALIGRDGRPAGKVYGYRDHRTEGIDEEVYKIISEKELYKRVGIQKAIYNTIFQLYAHKVQDAAALEEAQDLLLMPDLFHYLLSGRKVCEYSEATTTALIDPKTKNWDMELIGMLGFPKRIFREICMPGTSLGDLTESVQSRVGFNCRVVLPPSHDTASAVLAVPSDEKNTCYISSGTWSLMGVELDRADCSEESRQADLTNEGGYGGKITYLANIMGLWMIQSVRRELSPDIGYTELCELASKETIKSIVDCQDVSFLSPDSMTAAVAGFCKKTGQEIPKTLPQFAAVIYNSLADCYKKKLALIEGMTGMCYDKIHIIGGGSNAGYLNALTAKVTGRKVVAGPAEATAAGNILAQMIADGMFRDVKEARECVGRSFEVKVYS